MRALPVGLVTQFGTISAVGTIRGERYYLVTDRYGVWNRHDAADLENDPTLREQIQRLRENPWTGHLRPIVPPGTIEYGEPE